MKLSFFAFVTFFCSQVFAFTECPVLADKGVVLVPTGVTAQGLLVFLRGHHPAYGAVVPPKMRLKAALDTLKAYGLKAIAEAQNLALFVTGSSDMPFTLEDFEAIQDACDVELPSRLVLASHSGGYVGLRETLRELPVGDGPSLEIAMLDNFYAKDEESLAILRSHVEAGASCRGFYTFHNQDSFLKHYQDMCEGQGPYGFTHDGSVAPCLRRYLQGESCR